MKKVIFGILLLSATAWAGISPNTPPETFTELNTPTAIQRLNLLHFDIYNYLSQASSVTVSIGDLMKMSVYDIDLNNIVDNSQRLGNQLPAFYATQSGLNAVILSTGYLQSQINNLPSLLPSTNTWTGFNQYLNGISLNKIYGYTPNTYLDFATDVKVSSNVVSSKSITASSMTATANADIDGTIFTDIVRERVDTTGLLFKSNVNDTWMRIGANSNYVNSLAIGYATGGGGGSAIQDSCFVGDSNATSAAAYQVQMFGCYNKMKTPALGNPGKNVLIGLSNGSLSNRGIDNIFLGINLANYGGDLTGCILIGGNMGATDIGNYKLMIDTWATTAPLVYGDFNNNYLMINGSFSVTGNQEIQNNLRVMNNLTVTNTGYFTGISVSTLTVSKNILFPDGTVAISTAPFDHYSSNYVKATDSTTFTGQNNFPTISIATNVYMGYMRISDSYIIVSGTTSGDIQNAINALGANGGEVHLLAGTYSMNNNVLMKDSVTLSGCGSNTILKSVPYVEWLASTHTISIINCHNVEIRDLKIDGLSTTSGRTNDQLHIKRSRRINIRNVVFDFADNTSIYVDPTSPQVTDGLRIEGCNFYNSDGFAINIDGQAAQRNNIITNCVFGSASMGVCASGIILDANYWSITNCYFRTTTYGIQSYGSQSVISNNMFTGMQYGVYILSDTNITANSFAQCSIAGILVENAAAAFNIAGNNFLQSTLASVVLGISTAKTATNGIVCSNTMRLGGTACKEIKVMYAQNVLISENNIIGSPTAPGNAGIYIDGISSITVSNNITSGHNFGIYVATSATKVTLLNNQSICTTEISDNANLANQKNLYMVTRTEKFGINTTTPVATFDINGTLSIGNDANRVIYATTSANIDMTGFYMSSNTVVKGHLLRSDVFHINAGTEAVAIVIPCTQNVWSKITNTAGTLLNTFDTDGFTITSDSITVVHTADYTGQVSITFNAGVNEDYAFRIFNITQNRQASVRTSESGDGANNRRCVTMPLYLESTAGDRYRFEVMNLTNNNDPTINNVGFNILYLHE